MALLVLLGENSTHSNIIRVNLLHKLMIGVQVNKDRSTGEKELERMQPWPCVQQNGLRVDVSRTGGLPP